MVPKKVLLILACLLVALLLYGLSGTGYSRGARLFLRALVRHVL
jgi:hypothetical protein